jgi:hypothetical protein
MKELDALEKRLNKRRDKARTKQVHAVDVIAKYNAFYASHSSDVSSATLEGGSQRDEEGQDRRFAESEQGKVARNVRFQELEDGCAEQFTGSQGECSLAGVNLSGNEDEL